MKSGQVTIKDLARELKISAATVSRALKDHPDISKSTKKAVISLAEKLNYQPNSVAQSLRHSKTNTIGIIVPEIIHYFFSSVISGIEDVAYTEGYNVMICQSNEKIEREIANTNALLSNRVDGFLVSISKSTNNFDHFQNILNRNVPLVFFDRICTDINTHSVSVEDYEGAYKATRHLVEIGCKKIAHLSGPQNLLISYNRRQGYQDALLHHNLPLKNEWVLVADSLEDGFEAAKKLASLPKQDRPDAIFAVNDITAVGAMKALKECGLKIPEDMAIIGFSDDQKLAPLLEPPLSSVAQPGFEIGQEAIKLFLKEISKPEKDGIFEKKILKTELIIRESTRKNPI
ncbi:LacI family DNA-binding transcriptional regulator [Flexithrix dorotheae]|uniref:LacI family DNA-binding transcriptional regulator n=1 Tax=Flexithrix dorotheae TaxID=70993 RepID=UPI000373000E|nr:LacI family DNA-binding transcriptional regulator [Flexithrix dorotheae]